jgi:RNA polymerase sigma-70 factor (ECF subfamily)
VDWTKLLDQYGDRLFLFARQWSRDASEAEDFVQEGFVRFWKANGRQELSESTTLAYLFTAVRRAALDRRRSDRRREVRETLVSLEPDTTEPLFEWDLDQQFDQQQLESAIASLPVEQREVLVMKIWGELTFQAIAQVTGTSLGTVTSRYRYAVAALRRQLVKEMEKSHE